MMCYNGNCGDDGRCSLEDYCPVMAEEYEYQRRMYYAEPKPMSQEQQVAHFAWKHGNGPDPWSEE
jgi:hypothetical protein